MPARGASCTAPRSRASSGRPDRARRISRAQKSGRRHARRHGCPRYRSPLNDTRGTPSSISGFSSRTRALSGGNHARSRHCSIRSGGIAFTSPGFAQGGGGGGSSGGGGAGGTSAGTGGATGAETPSSSAATVPVQPQGPVTGQINPGVAPSAPGPSTAKSPPRVSPDIAQPGYASSHRQPRAEDVPQGDPSSADPIKDLDKQIDRKLSICRGC
jgi:hypothetical protein